MFLFNPLFYKKILFKDLFFLLNIKIFSSFIKEVLIVILKLYYLYIILGLPRWLSDKGFSCNAGDPGSIPGSRSTLGEGNGNPFQYSCQENPMDRGTWKTTVYVVVKNWTQLNNKKLSFIFLLYSFSFKLERTCLFESPPVFTIIILLYNFVYTCIVYTSHLSVLFI